MILAEMSVWDSDIKPRVRRNQSLPGHEIVVIDMTGEQCGSRSVKLITTSTAQARALADSLLRTADELVALADTIDAEREQAERAAEAQQHNEQAAQDWLGGSYSHGAP